MIQLIMDSYIKLTKGGVGDFLLSLLEHAEVAMYAGEAPLWEQTSTRTFKNVLSSSEV